MTRLPPDMTPRQKQFEAFVFGFTAGALFTLIVGQLAVFFGLRSFP